MNISYIQWLWTVQDFYSLFNNISLGVATRRSVSGREINVTVTTCVRWGSKCTLTHGDGNTGEEGLPAPYIYPQRHVPRLATRNSVTRRYWEINHTRLFTIDNISLNNLWSIDYSINIIKTNASQYTAAQPVWWTIEYGRTTEFSIWRSHPFPVITVSCTNMGWSKAKALPLFLYTSGLGEQSKVLKDSTI